VLPLGVQKDKNPHPSSFSREIVNEQGYLIGRLQKVKRRIGTQDKPLYMEAPFCMYVYFSQRGIEQYYGYSQLWYSHIIHRALGLSRVQ
jgi:hypothetical protein